MRPNVSYVPPCSIVCMHSRAHYCHVTYPVAIEESSVHCLQPSQPFLPDWRQFGILTVPFADVVERLVEAHFSSDDRELFIHQFVITHQFAVGLPPRDADGSLLAHYFL